MLANPEMISKYVKNGNSELHWNDKKKVSHFELIKLLKNDYLDEIVQSATFLKKWNNNKMIAIINNIDNVLPHDHSKYKLSDNTVSLNQSARTLLIFMTSGISKRLKLPIHSMYWENHRGSRYWITLNF